MRTIISRGGGISDWVWKGSPAGGASIEAIISNPHGDQPIRHVLEFRSEKQVFRLVDERIENEKPNAGLMEPFFYYRYQKGHPVINVAGQEGKRGLARESVEPDLSILAQRRDPDAYPVLSYLASAYERVRIYREWAFGRNAVFREPQKADLRNDRLEEDFSNLGLFLNRLRQKPKAKRAILAALGDLYEGLSDFDVSIEGGTCRFSSPKVISPFPQRAYQTVRCAISVCWRFCAIPIHLHLSALRSLSWVYIRTFYPKWLIF
jgi:predicted ATPase